LVRLAPGAEVTHVETWALLPDVSRLADEADVAQHLLPRLQPYLAQE